MTSIANARRAHVMIDARKAFDGGIGRHLREIVRRLPALLPECRFTLLTEPGRADELEAEGLGPTSFTLVDEEAAKYGLGELGALRSVAARLHADLFHAPHYVLPPRMPCPTIVTIHDVIHLKRPRTPVHRLYAQLAMRSACRQARRVVTVSHASARDLERYVGVDPARVVVIPNGVTIPDATPVATPPQRYVLYVGSLKPHKNVGILVEAFTEVARASTLELWLAGQWRGEEGYRRELWTRVVRSGLARRVRFLGAFPETSLGVLLGGARLLVSPSWEEGFGLPALEALAHGTPVIASRRGAHPEVLGDAAVFVDGSSGPELARAIVEIDGWSGAERHRRGERGRERARAFPWDGAARQTADVYRVVLNGLGCQPVDAPKR